MSKNLPIKVIMQREKDIEKNIPGGGGKEFRTIDKAFIGEISFKLNELLSYYNNVFSLGLDIPAIGKITLREDAVAKSHRPNDLCKELDVIGSRALTELYIKLTPKGILKTINKINSTNLSKNIKANLSTIVSIDPIYPSEKISVDLGTSDNDTIEHLKIKLFKFDNEYDNLRLNSYVEKEIVSLGYGEFVKYNYGDKLEYLSLSNVKPQDIEKIALINGIKDLDIFQDYTSPTQDYTSSNFTGIDEKGIEDSELIIGVIDSGISDNTILAKYVIGRKEYVPPQYQNRRHGTFVASSILFGSQFDGKVQESAKSFKLFDVIAMPNSDPKMGLTETLSETDLYTLIDEVMKDYSDKIKIWNISLGTKSLVIDNKVSDLAIFLDYAQEKYKVQFIVAAGNYKSQPLRTWPSQILSQIDRITSPADSVRSISVGSIASKSNINSLVKVNEPSPFSRKGPGANYMIKPDIVDFGGNQLKNGFCKDVGVLGFNVDGKVIEGIGTSYSTPRITYKLAKVIDELVEKDLLMAKGFLIHDARINSKYINMASDDIKYYGFGQPSQDPQNILACDDTEITLVFKQSITKGTHLEMLNFPYPKSLIKNGKYTGEIFMTLLYNPILDEKYGSQYCRVNFDASFGTYTADPTTGEIEYAGQVPLEKTWDERYEKARIENGFKWSPIKSYYRNMKNGINVGSGWKIRVDMQERSILETTKHEFLLIITIRGKESSTVYNDVVTELQSRGYITNNLETRQQIRQKN